MPTTTLTWLPGGAQGNRPHDFQWTPLLVLAGGSLSIISANTDRKGVVRIVHMNDAHDFRYDVDWYVPTYQIAVPVPGGE